MVIVTFFKQTSGLTMELLALQLRWLKPVSTRSRDLVIKRTVTTTLYHVTAIFLYHVQHQLLLNKMQ